MVVVLYPCTRVNIKVIYVLYTANFGVNIILTQNYEILAIQIKICAEYRDMLPRPRLVCQMYLTDPAEGRVACPGILHISLFVL